jgi:hypothetical protein
MEASGSSELCVAIYPAIRCHITEDSDFHSHRCENLKSRYHRIEIWKKLHFLRKENRLIKPPWCLGVCLTVSVFVSHFEQLTDFHDLSHESFKLSLEAALKPKF